MQIVPSAVPNKSMHKAHDPVLGDAHLSGVWFNWKCISVSRQVHLLRLAPGRCVLQWSVHILAGLRGTRIAWPGPLIESLSWSMSYDCSWTYVATNWLHSWDKMSRQVQLWLEWLSTFLYAFSFRAIFSSLCMPKLTLEIWAWLHLHLPSCVHGGHASVGMEWKPRSRRSICMAMRAAVSWFSVHISTKGLVEIGLSSTRRHLQISEHFNLAADQRQTKHLSVNRNFAEALTSEVMACGRTKHTAPSPILHVVMCKSVRFQHI